MSAALIPAKNAQIHWSAHERYNPDLVDRVLVFDRTVPWTDDESLECSAGACCSDWLDGTDPRSTPEGVYATWLQTGFKDQEAHVAALRELAKIEDCQWAGRIADALDGKAFAPTEASDEQW